MLERGNTVPNDDSPHVATLDESEFIELRWASIDEVGQRSTIFHRVRVVAECQRFRSVFASRQLAQAISTAEVFWRAEQDEHDCGRRYVLLQTPHILQVIDIEKTSHTRNQKL